MILRLPGVALAAWLGGGAVVYGATHARYGLTPSIVWLVVATAAAILLRRSTIALLALVLLLPWLPLRVPPALLIWTGHAAVWIWMLIAAALAVRWIRRRALPSWRALAADPRRAPVAAFIVSAVAFNVAAWAVSPQLPAGDEPHYLVITQSLLRDHDLQIENNHTRGDYHAYFSGDLRPDYLRRGTNEQIYSVHAPGLPAIVAPAFALFGYAGVTVFLAILGAAASAIAWTTAWRVTGSAAAAWFGWGAVTLSEPFFVQSFMVYPDAPAGAIVIVAVATLVLGREASVRRLALTGAALGLLPWLHTRAAILAATLALVLARRQRGAGAGKRIAALAAAPIVSAVAWFAFFYAIYGTPDPRAPYGGAHQMTLDSLPRGIIGLLFDQQFGLLPTAPVYLCAAAGFFVLARQHKRLAIELAVALVPYAVAVAAFQMWWAGYTTPARFLVPTLLPLAIPAAAWFASARSAGSRLAGLLALGVSALVTSTVVSVGRGALLLNFRDGASRLLAWLSSAVDLTRAAPSLFQRDLPVVLLQGLVWLAAGAALVAAAKTLERRTRAEALTVGIGSSAAALTMIAATVVWGSNQTTGVTADGGALAYLTAYDGDARQVAISLFPLHGIRRVDVPPRLTLVDARPAGDEPLANLRHIPAATYRVELSLARPAAGRISATLDRALGATWTFDAADAGGVWRRELVVPAASPELVVDADPPLRASIDRVTVRALAVPGSGHRLADSEAAHAVRYGHVLMFLLGGDAFVEPAGTWIQGGSSAEFALVAEDGRPIHVLVRTPPVANRVSFDGAGWHREVLLAPGESKLVDVPITRMRITVASGARPVDFEPGSRDVRYLGAWIESR